jgi:23S rRNA (uracil1939-C5)-methyltransferase
MSTHAICAVKWPRYTYHLFLSIEKLIYGGDGLSRAPSATDGRSMAVFVPFVLPGEQIDAEIIQSKPGFARASVTNLIAASPDRIAPHCPYFQQCGGCHYQHIPYARQLEFKAGILRETLQRIAKIELKSEIRVHASPPWSYRNRTRLQVRIEPEFALGYFRVNSRDFSSVRECPISSPLLNRVIARLLELEGLNCPPAVEEIELFADAADERLLASAFCERDADKKDLLRWAEALTQELPEMVSEKFGMAFFSSRPRLEVDNAPADQKVLAQSGAKAIRYRVGEHDYQVSTGAFFQVNRHLVDELVSVVTGGAGGELALDLYAGVGLFSAVLAKNFHHILGIEASQTAHTDLVQNVPANVKAVAARTEDYLKSVYPISRPARKRPDLIVLDPPRAGAGKAVIRSLLELGAPRVRYVACDPATLARDLALLLAAGYHVEEAHLFDLFPQTFHIESVMLLAR